APHRAGRPGGERAGPVDPGGRAAPGGGRLHFREHGPQPGAGRPSGCLPAPGGGHPRCPDPERLPIDWGPGGPKPLCPDLAVILDVADPSRQRATFDVQAEHTRPSLIVEIVSPHIRSNDVVEKVALYHQANVPEYVIIDQQREGGPRSLIHYRHAPGG